MKVLIPVGAIIVGSGFCCCSGEFLEGFKQGAQEAIQEAEQKQAEAEGTAVAGAEQPMAGSATAAPGTALEGACGRFKTMGITAPAGTKVTVCTTDSGSDSLILELGVDPESACKTFKGWAESNGFTVQSEGTFGGTSSVVAYSSTDQFVAGCMNVMGKDTATLSMQAK